MHGSSRGKNRKGRRRAGVAALTLLMATTLLPELAPVASAQAVEYDVTIEVGNYVPTAPYATPGQTPTKIENFRYLVNEDNTGDPTDLDPTMHPSIHQMASNSPVVMQGVEEDCPPSTAILECSTTLTLPEGRYLVTIQANIPIIQSGPMAGEPEPATHHASTTHKMWGVHLRLPDDANTTKQVDLIPFPLQTGRLVAHVFPDVNQVNGAPDIGELAGVGNEQPGLEDFNIVIHDVIDEIVTENFYGDPICSEYAPGDTPGEDPPIDDTGGECLTDDAGTAIIPDLAPGKYHIYAIPPEGSGWIQTTTFEGTFAIDHSRVTEKDDGQGAIREGLLEQVVQPTSYWFGFVQEESFTGIRTGRILGCVGTWVGFPPFDGPVINPNEPISDGYVALSSIGADEQVYTAPLGTNANCPGGVGRIDIRNVPPGNYSMFLWDEQLNYIFRQITVTVPPGGGVVQLEGDDGEGNVGLFRWFAWMSGRVYNDTDRDGIRDPGEVAIPNVDLDVRFRDGSVKAETFTDRTGYYEYPQIISKLVKFVVGEVGFGRWGTTGPCTYNEYWDPTDNTGPDAWNNSMYNPNGRCRAFLSEAGGGLLTGELLVEGHRTMVDWGKYPYDQDETGQITGIVFYATTRNELDPRFAGAEPYEPGIPGVPVNLWSLGANGVWNGGAGDDLLVSRYADGEGSDAWGHPTAANQGSNGGCNVLDANGDPVVPQPETNTGILVAPNCLEFPSLLNETKDAAFDGGYAFAEYCPNGWNDNVNGGCASPQPLVPDDYVVQVVPPSPYEIVKEEDVNVDQGEEFIPNVTPFPCVGPSHLVADERSPYDGENRPLCTERLVTLKGGENLGADFFLFTGTPIPGRIFGLVSDDINIDLDPTSPWFGEPRPIPNIPIGIRDYSYRLLTTVTTDEYGMYEALLPSTDTAFCPTPAGTCGGTYVFVINDPGDPLAPNLNFDPNYITEPLAFDVMPGQMTPLDTPLDPISGVACAQYTGPEFFAVQNLAGSAGDGSDGPLVIERSLGATAARRNVILRGVGFGVTRVNADGAGSITLVHQNGAQYVLNTAAAFGGPGSPGWTDTQITFRFPAFLGGQLPPGPYQVLITAPPPAEAPDASLTAPTGITLHYVGTIAGPADYTPFVRYVDGLNGNDGASGSNGSPWETIQRALDSTANLVIVKPATYIEHPIMWRQQKLQGYGPGGVNGPAVEPGPPEDPLRQVPGTAINASFFDADNVMAQAWRVKANALVNSGDTDVPGGSLSPPVPYPAGAGITVAPNDVRFGESLGLSRAMIDGFAIFAARAETTFDTGGGSGVFVNGYARNLKISNNFIDGNHGNVGGGIVLGAPYRGVNLRTDNQNDDVVISRNRLVGNGGTRWAGAIGIYNGAEDYLVANNDLCSNFSAEYGGGVSQFGLSDDGRVIENTFTFNSAFDEGGALMIAGQLPIDDQGYRGTGDVDVDRNRFSHNQSNDDGGAIKVLEALTDRIRIRSNLIMNNNAADIGGGIALGDSTNVQIVNNTIARNSSTSSCETCAGTGPHAGGIGSEPHSTTLDPQLPGVFSNPSVLLNNLFFENAAYTVDLTAIPGDDPLVFEGLMDFEVMGRPDLLFSPQWSTLSTPYAGGANNTVFPAPDPGVELGTDSPFVLVIVTQLQVGFSHQTGEIIVNILPIGGEPGVPGEDGVPGDYHLCGPPVSGPGCLAAIAIDDGAPNSAALGAPTFDIDGLGTRPTNGDNVGGARWDRGGDELIFPGPPQVAL